MGNVLAIAVGVLLAHVVTKNFWAIFKVFAMLVLLVVMVGSVVLVNHIGR